MLYPLFVILFFSFLCQAINLVAVGSPTYYPFIKAWADTYSVLNPEFQLSFEPSKAVSGIDQIAHFEHGAVFGNDSIDIVLSDGSVPSEEQYETGLQPVPILITTYVAQVNFAFKKDILLTGSVLADIYLGHITTWNHPNITSRNPDLVMPNDTIKVFYRSDETTATQLWSGFLSKRSHEWNETYGTVLTFPDDLAAKPNFVGYPDSLTLNAAVASNFNSIAYIAYYEVARDPGLHYAHLYNLASGKATTPANFAADALKLNARLEPTTIIDPPANNYSWPIIVPIGIIVHTKPAECQRAKELYKFLRWVITSDFARKATYQFGCVPITEELIHRTLSALGQIKCSDGESIATPEEDSTVDPVSILFTTISVIIVAAALVTSGLHIYHFRSSSILLIYSLIFVFGTILTLLSAVFWSLSPDNDSLCRTRIWTVSLGFSIMLGTMFSKTWQLQEIYYLQKGGLDALKKKISTNKTYVQLAVTLLGVIFVDFIILLAWALYDPMSSTFVIDNEVLLTGYWTCHSNNIVPWLLVELFFFLSLLLFGIYVIYDTWEFQRAVLLSETRWVLFALYNVILNIFAIAPFLSYADLSDRTLRLIAMASIDISAGSIASAVLLPKLLSNFSWSKSSKNKKGSTGSGVPSLLPTSFNARSLNNPTENLTRIESKQKKHRRPSRTPEEELAKRLADPHPYGTEASTVELQSMDPGYIGRIEPPDLDSPSAHPTPTPMESPLPSLRKHFIETPKTPSEDGCESALSGTRSPLSSSYDPSLVVQTALGESLQWSNNPIQEE